MNRFLCKLRFSGTVRIFEFLTKAASHHYRVLINFSDFRFEEEGTHYVLLVIEADASDLSSFFEAFHDFLQVMEITVLESLSANYEDLTSMSPPGLTQVHAIFQQIANQNSE